jgi:hypothetical protein
VGDQEFPPGRLPSQSLVALSFVRSEQSQAALELIRLVDLVRIRQPDVGLAFGKGLHLSSS